ncbi:hypothetical protein IE53DRAFT_333168, partial [Violaceomyces palustris]
MANSYLSPVSPNFPSESFANASSSSSSTPSQPPYPPSPRSNNHIPISSSRRQSQTDMDDEALEDIRRYESFSTVDWIVDGTRERNRLARERSANSSTGIGNTEAIWGATHFGSASAGIPPRWWPRNEWGRRGWWMVGIAKSALSAATDSGVVVLVGILIGLNMALISIATEWASDLKQGYCSSGWWLNEKFCCWEMMDQAGPGGAIAPLKAVPAQITATVTVTAAQAASTAPVLKNLATGLANATQLVSRSFSFDDHLLDQSAFSVAGHSERVRRGLGHGLNLLSRAAGDSPGSGGDLSETCTDWVPWSRWTFPAWIVYIIFAGILAWTCAHLVKSFAPYAAGSGISEIKCILAGFVINGYLGVWTLLIKSLTLPLAIASGLSVGKEGPAVHVACCIGNVVSQYFKSFNRSQAKMRELLTASSAAGVAVAFGSPIGGVLFSLEEMAYNFPASTMWRSFLCALAATVTLSFMNPFRTGKLVLFQVSYDRDWHYFEILFYIIIGIFGGLYGAFVIKYNLQVQSFRRNNLTKYGVQEAVILACLTAFVGYFNKFLRIDMTESLEILFRECEGGGDYDNLCQSWAQWRMINSLLLATVLRTILVIISYGCKVPAGIFVPSMAIGATFGRMVGILVKALYNAYPNSSLFSACQPDVPCITPGTYAFLGAAAALAGVTRITVAVVVIMFELTGALTYILPTMIVVGITKGIGDWYGKGGIAEQMIKFSGYPFLDKEDHSFGISVSEVMKKDPVTLVSKGISLRGLERKLNDGSYKGFPVISGSRDDHGRGGILLGYVGKTELRYAISRARRVRDLSGDTICKFSCDVEDEGTEVRKKVGRNAAFDLPTTATTSSTDGAAGRIKRSRREDESVNLMGSGNDGEDSDDEEGNVLENGDRLGHEGGILGDAGGGIDGEGGADILELAGWVDQTPLVVAPSMALEVVMDLFKKMGPRVILVSKHGRLVGLVTVKDVLKHIAAQERAEHNAAASRSRADPNLLPTSGAGGASSEFSTGSGELELLLVDIWDWGRGLAEKVAPRINQFASKLGI